MKKGKLVAAIGGGVFLMIFILYMAGFFTGKIAPGQVRRPLRLPGVLLRLAQVKLRQITPYYEAIATVASQQRTVVSAQISGVVEAVYYREGSQVQPQLSGEVGGDYRRQLNQGLFPKLLRQQFQKLGIELGPELIISVKAIDKRWWLFDSVNDRRYELSASTANSCKIIYQPLLIKIADDEFRVKLSQSAQGVEMAEAARLQAVQMYNAAQANYNRVHYQYSSAQSSLAQAEQRLNAAKAAFQQTQSEYARIKKFKEQGAATQQKLEQTEAKFLQAQAAREQARLGIKQAQAQLAGIEEVVKSARAGVEQAKSGIDGARARRHQAQQQMRSAQIAWSYTRICASSAGVVVEKKVEPGDLSWPGKPLLIIDKPQLLQLEARVPESLRQRVTLHQRFPVVVDAIGYRQKGEVTEIVPYADPWSRTFIVKLAIPFQSGIYPGMFGKLFIGLPAVSVLLVPAAAVQPIGQFTSVYVEEQPQQWVRRFITLGQRYGDQIEVLSGVNSGEKVAIFKEDGDA